MKEYKCKECGETFVEPRDFPDYAALHGIREDGEFCGGEGELEGEWDPERSGGNDRHSDDGDLEGMRKGLIAE